MSSGFKIRWLVSVGEHGHLFTHTDQYICMFIGFWNMQTPKKCKHQMIGIWHFWIKKMVNVSRNI